MSDPFDAFESALSGETNIETLQDAKSDDPAADFLAREQVELAKIENDNFDTFGDFGMRSKTILRSLKKINFP